MFKEFKWSWAVIGSIVTAASVISLIQRWGDIELARIPELYLQYYRNIITGLVGWIPLPFDWKFPDWYVDLMGIVFILNILNDRTNSINPHDQLPEPPLVNPPPMPSQNSTPLQDALSGTIINLVLILAAPFGLLFALFRIGLRFFALIIFRPQEYDVFRRGEISKIHFQHHVLALLTMALLAAITAVSTMLFFLTNARLIH